MNGPGLSVAKTNHCMPVDILLWVQFCDSSPDEAVYETDPKLLLTQ